MSKFTALLFGVIVLSPCASGDTTEARGEYLAELSDCVACHTAVGGQRYAGGLSFATPFGTLYSSNITPDKEHGIGNYSFEDFRSALTRGVGPKGNLYPAMPYTSFHLLKEDDLQALYDYFMSIPPVQYTPPDNDLTFPFNIRAGLSLWRAVFLDTAPYTENTDKSAQWNRGNYLINGPGHCGECHTPRNRFFALQSNQALQGSFLGDIWMPDITPDTLRAQGWGHSDLIDLLQRGYSDRGVVVGDMFTVVRHSTSKFKADDLQAAAVYLLDSDKELPPEPLTFNGENRSHPGYGTYAGFCASCHGYQGEGMPNFAPGLRSNASLYQHHPNNTLSAILFGVAAQRYSQTMAFYDMPGYNEQLDDQQLTDLLNYMLVSYTDLEKRYSVAEISALRKTLGRATLH